MRKYIGVAPGAGTSALYVGLGFVPKAVTLTNDQGEGEIITWNIGMWRTLLSYGGRIRTALDGDIALLTTAGVNPYWGGDIVTTKSANQVVRANQIADYNGDMRAKGASSPVTRWTKDTTALKGHFDFPISDTYVKAGSLIWIRSDTTGIMRPYVLRVLANDGDATDDITLDVNVPTGAVERITYFSDFVQAPVGTKMPAGIAIADVTYLNVTAQNIVIEVEDMDDL